MMSDLARGVEFKWGEREQNLFVLAERSHGIEKGGYCCSEGKELEHAVERRV
jgi:hypothetical protein